MTQGGWRSWRHAMSDALYGDNGFYRVSGAPGRNFRTAAQVGEVWAAAIHELARRVDAALGNPADFTIVDVGAGGGELLAGLAMLAPGHWRLVGVDVAPRPARIPDRIEWRSEGPVDVSGLLLAVELLDVVPVEVIEVTDEGPRTIEVTTGGDERPGGAPGPADGNWLERWCPDLEVGDRFEVGRYRDEVWRDAVSTLGAGVAVAVDYPVDITTHRHGTLTGFRDGQQVVPIPDGRCDLTAHVRFESLRRDGDLLLSQRDALRDLGLTAVRPAYDDDPVAYLSSLTTAGDAAELMNTDGLGGFSWLVHGVSVDPEPVLPRNTRAERTSARTSSMRQ